MTPNSAEVIVAGYQSQRPQQTGGMGAAIGFIAVIVIALVIVAKAGLIPAGAESTANTKPASSVSAAILAEAKKYDDDPYVWGGGHPPSAYKKGDGLDCSGLIDVAVLKVTGINENYTARDFRTSKYWKKVKLRKAKAGDLVYLLMERHPGHTSDHVAIVVSNHGSGKLTVFEAASARIRPRSLQIRQSSGHHYSDYDGALRFRGR